jgi:hypothetical protein
MFDPPIRPVPDPPTRVPEYPRTRTRGTRVPATDTGMRRIGYDFEKKNLSTCARRIRARRTRCPPRVYLTRTLRQITIYIRSKKKRYDVV